MSDPIAPLDEPLDGIAERVTAVEGLPLAERAVGYSALYDELAARLEAGDSAGER